MRFHLPSHAMSRQAPKASMPHASPWGILVAHSAYAKASPFGRGVTEGDGEGKPGTKEPLRSDGQALCQSDTIAVQSCLAAALPSQSGLRPPRPGCGTQRLLRCRSHPAGRGPNSSSLFPPLAAVVAVAPKGGAIGMSGQASRRTTLSVRLRSTRAGRWLPAAAAAPGQRALSSCRCPRQRITPCFRDTGGGRLAVAPGRRASGRGSSTLREPCRARLVFQSASVNLWKMHD